MIPSWNFLSWAKDRFGASRALSAYPRALLKRLVAIPAANQSVYIRPNTADQFVYDEVFITREYALDIPEPKLIVDAGAHIGLATVFFAQRWPNAKIIAIEPDSSNFRVLKRNTERFPQVIPIQSGVWSKDTRLRIANPGADTWSFQVVESADGFPAVTINTLVRQYGQIDLLKLDIEGSEKTVLEHSKDWIHQIRTLVVELHDRHVPGCTDALETAISGIPFRRSLSGESVVLAR